MVEKDKKIQIINETNDWKYFTIVPNYILNHSTSDEQALYLQMKRFAGERGQCFATQQTLGKQVGWERRKVRKVIKQLLERKWILRDGTKNVSGGEIDVYRIVDLWKININCYEKQEDNYGPKTSMVKQGLWDTEVHNYGTRRSIKEKLIKEKPNSLIELKKEDEFYKDIPNSDNIKGKMLSVIKCFAGFKNFVFSNGGAHSLFIRRNARPAKDLAENYPIEKVEEVMGWLSKNADFKWTLESVIKYINEDLDLLGDKMRKGQGEYKCDRGVWHPRGTTCGCSTIPSWKEHV